ncbi:MAG: nuclease-related domain-containing protein [Candidatus Deferrimicrobiaceae bacterium]
MAMAKTTTAPGRAAEQNKAGPGTRKMPIPLLVAGTSAIAGVFMISLFFPQNVKNIGSFGPGALVAAFVVGVAAIQYLETYSREKGRRGRDAGTGTDAEVAVRDVLESLPEGYFVVHDFDSGKGMIGRILIGPKGIFTLETRSHTGEVTFDGNQLLRNGRPFGKDWIRRAWGQCFLVRGLLAEWGITTPLPEPVILFANAHVKVQGKARGVEIAGLRSLPKILDPLPNRLSIPEAGRIYNRILAASLL